MSVFRHILPGKNCILFFFGQKFPFFRRLLREFCGLRNFPEYAFHCDFLTDGLMAVGDFYVAQGHGRRPVAHESHERQVIYSAHGGERGKGVAQGVEVYPLQGMPFSSWCLVEAHLSNQLVILFWHRLAWGASGGEEDWLQGIIWRVQAQALLKHCGHRPKAKMREPGPPVFASIDQMPLQSLTVELVDLSGPQPQGEAEDYITIHVMICAGFEPPLSGGLQELNCFLRR